MTSDMPEELKGLLRYLSVPGALGGVVAFLYAVGQKEITRHHIRKFAIGVIPAAITAAILAPLIPPPRCQEFYAFAVGLTWAGIVEVVRRRITAVVEALLGDLSGKGKGQ